MQIQRENLHKPKRQSNQTLFNQPIPNLLMLPQKHGLQRRRTSKNGVALRRSKHSLH